MSQRSRLVTVLVLAWVVMIAAVQGQSGQPAAGQAARPAAAPAAKPATAPAGKTAAPGSFDLANAPTLFVVGYAHLDTQWRWDYVTTIREYLPKTIRDNFALFEKYPNYVFNFSGSNRYRMIKEYYPADYEKVKKYIAAGRWFPSGSSMEENDVNSPSAESIVRQILYGTQYFKREFGKTSAEFMLPDCFGFPASLPSILAHTGIIGFSTQKLSSSWQPAARVGGPASPEKTPDGIPFNVGVWEGPDGKTVYAALNPGSYSGSVTYDISKTPPPPPQPVATAANPQPAAPRPLVDWPARVNYNGQVTGLFTDFMYYGTGDTGGTPTESSVRLMDAMVAKKKTVLPPTFGGGGGRGAQAGPAQPPASPAQEVLVGDGPLKIVSATAEQMFLALKSTDTSRLPRYKGDLELINHSAGSITSQAYLKRWNRVNEVLADDAERASVAAAWLGSRPYPIKRLNDAWTLVMGGQFHDIIPGTSLPKAYEYSWNDEVLAMNQFAGVLTDAVDAVAAAMDTQAAGIPVVVYNPLNIAREDIVEAAVTFPGAGPKAVRVTGPDGKDVPAQLTAGGKVLIAANVPAVGYAVYDVQAAAAPAASALKITESSLENARYRIALNGYGDIASIFDKSVGKELLSAPARLEIKTDNPRNWPAWNMDYEDQMRAPRAYVQGVPAIRIVENGPVRVALEVTRETEGSKFAQTIRLSAGDAGNRVEFSNAIDWMTKEAHLKAVFPLTASNRMATYNWDVGTIERASNDERQFEVASHQWFDLTDRSGVFGVTVLSDKKTASDKPNDSTLRLTLVRTPGTRGGYEDQGTQDLGHHDIVYGLAGHAGGWRAAQTDWQGLRLNQPLVAFESPRHAGAIGKTFSLLKINNSRVRVLAVKKAEQSDEVVVRLVELDGAKADDVRLTFAAPVVAAREMNGVETAVGPATVAGGQLVTSFGPYQLRTFAVKLGPAPAQTRAAALVSKPVTLPYNQAVASRDGSVSGGRFDSTGRALPAEMLPREIDAGSTRFNLASPDAFNAVIPRGQTIDLPAGTCTRLYVLAAASEGDQRAIFRVGETNTELTIQDWGGYIGQWDNRIWKSREEPVPPRAGQPAPPAGTPVRMRTVDEYAGLKPGFIKRTPVAWFASHRHSPDGSNDIYQYAYLYMYAIDVPAGAKTLTLPVSERIKILAVTAVNEGARVRPAQPLYDTLER